MQPELSPFVITASIVYGLGVFAFVIAALIFWSQNRQRFRPYREFGFVIAGVEVVLGIVAGVLALFVTGRPLLDPIFFCGGLVVAQGIAFFRTTALTVSGLYYGDTLGVPTMPYLRTWARDALMNGPPPTEPEPDVLLSLDFTPLDLSSETADALDIPDPYEQKEEEAPPEEPLPRPIMPDASAGEMVTTAVGLGLFTGIVSLLLFWATGAEISQLLRSNIEVGIEVSWAELPLALTIAVTAGFVEEIMFRLGIQNMLAKGIGRYNPAIVLTAALWTIGHVGMLEPEWIKMVQVFPIGLVLGWMYKRYGVESTVIAHVVLNLITAVGGTILLG